MRSPNFTKVADQTTRAIRPDHGATFTTHTSPRTHAPTDQSHRMSQPTLSDHQLSAGPARSISPYQDQDGTPQGLDIALAVLLGISIPVCVICYALEVVKPWRPASLQMLKFIFWIPRIAWAVCGIVAIAQISRPIADDTPTGSAAEQCMISFNTDIGGIGVRVGLSYSTGLSLCTLAIGSLTRREIGTKEVGVSQLSSKSTCFYHQAGFSF